MFISTIKVIFFLKLAKFDLLMRGKSCIFGKYVKCIIETNLLPIP
jgi:hypothetical protein